LYQEGKKIDLESVFENINALEKDIALLQEKKKCQEEASDMLPMFLNLANSGWEYLY